MAGKSGFAISISAVDNATKTIDAVNRRIAALTAPAEKFNKSVSKFADVSGINRMSEGMASLSARSLDTFRSLDRIVPALGAITGAASIAGMAALVDRFAQLGQQTQLLGQKLGVPTDRLSAFRAAARLAGASAEDMDSGLASLDERLRGATFGRDPAAIQLFNMLGVSFKNADGTARSAADAMGDVANGIANLKNHGAQLRAVQLLGMEGLLPLLRQGRDGLAGLVSEAERLGIVLTPSMAQRATDLAQSVTRVSLAAEGLGNKIADKLSPAITPLLNQLSTWIAKNGDWIAKDIGDYVQRFADNLPAMVDKIGDVAKAVDDVAQKFGGWQTVIEGLIGVKIASWLIGILSPLLGIARALALINPATAAVAAVAGAGYLGFKGAEKSGSDIASWGNFGFRPKTIDEWGNATSYQFDPGADQMAEWAAMDRPRGRSLDVSRAGGYGDRVSYGVPADLPSIAPDIEAEVRQNARRRGLDEEHMVRLARMEQGGYDKVSKAGAIGTMQLMPDTARSLGVDPHNWRANVEGGVRLYRNLLDKFGGNYAAADAAYNAGPGGRGVSHFAATGDPSQLPSETQNYVQRIDGHVQVDVRLSGAPPGTSATARASGPIRASPPRVEMPMHPAGY